MPVRAENAIFVFDEDDRPLDRDLQKGYTISVGRVREDESRIFDFKFVALSHNSEFSDFMFSSDCTDSSFSGHWSCWLIDIKRGCGAQGFCMIMIPQAT